ncbi:hypothetical protein MASR2M18_19980 [Ignavibacteria bacterium]|nr:sulfite exporter TauE/SafE family protein [Bacteroidota bacterium]
MHDITWHGIIVAIGLFLGFMSGMFGIGGGLIGTPLLALAGLPPFLALATPLPAALPSALSGSYIYYRERLIHFPLLWKTLLTALPFNLLGAWATTFATGAAMMYFTGGLILVIGSTFFVRGWMLKPAGEEQPRVGWLSTVTAGAAAGFLSGFLAIGGGMILVPMFVKVNKLPLKNALATSLLCVAALSIPGSVAHLYLGHINLYIALILTICVIPAANVGARMAVKLRNATLERIYGVWMILFAIYFLATR